MGVCCVCAVLVEVRERVQMPGQRLQIVLGCRVGAGNRTRSSGTAACVLACYAVFPAATQHLPQSVAPANGYMKACSGSAHGNVRRSPKHVKEVGVFIICQFLMKTLV